MSPTDSELRRALRNESKYRSLCDAAADAIITIDPATGRLEDANLFALQQYGYTREELIGLPVTELSAEPEKTSETIRDLARTRMPRVLSRLHKRKDGTVFQTEINASVMEIDGRPLIVGVVRDVTERVRAQALLEDSELRLRQLAENIPQVFWLIEPGMRRTVYISPAYETIWGRSCESLYRDPSDWLEGVLPEDRERIRQIATVEWDVPKGASFRVRRPDAQVRHIRALGFPVRDSAGTVVRIAGLAEDVTEQLEGELKLRETEKQLHQAQKMEAVGRLAGGVAHDFNNILTAIIGLTDMSLKALKDHPVRADLEEIHAAAFRAAELTRQLLMFSRRQIVMPKAIDVDEAVLKLAKMLRRIIGEDLGLDVATNARGAVVEADPSQLEQLIMNLAVNARDAMPEGGVVALTTGVASVEDETSATGEPIPPGEYVALSVTDTGVGMGDEIKAHLFEPFFTTKEQGKGTGLGLATCYGIVKQHGGAIQCRSIMGRGTTFRVLLPRKTAKPEPAARDDGVPASGTETILVVEDETQVRKLVERILGGLGYRVLLAPDGEAGLAVLGADAGKSVRLVITDMVMPKLGGKKLAAEIGRMRPDVRILFTSGYTDDMIGGQSPVPAEKDFLRKPFAGRELARRVRRALDEPREG